MGLDPAQFPDDTLSSENRTTGFKNKAFQGFALKANDRLERVLRRHPDVKRKIRAFYFKINGKPVEDEIPASVRDELTERYREPNARLAAQLEAAGIALPRWLSGQRRSAERALDARTTHRHLRPTFRSATGVGGGNRLVEPSGHDVRRRALEHEQHQRRDRDPGVVERVPEDRGEREARRACAR